MDRAASYPRRGTDLALYFVLAYAFTFGFAWLASAAGFSPSLTNLATILLHYGPAVAAVVAAWATGGGRAVRGLLAPILAWRVPARWYGIALFLPLAIRLVARGVDRLVGGAPLPYFVAGDASGVPAGVHPLVLLVPVFLGVLFQAGIAEEIGWRGFALPRLQRRFGALASSLILGVLWCLWHYDPQRAPGLLDRGLWYPAAIIPFTILITWVYNSTGGSLLLVILFHTASNTADWIAPTANLAGATAVATLRPFIIQIGLTSAIALWVILRHGARNLAARPRATGHEKGVSRRQPGGAARPHPPAGHLGRSGRQQQNTQDQD